MAKKFFIPLRNLLDSFMALDVDQIALDIAKTNAHKRLVISLNTEGTPTSQLYELGEDSLGKSLGDYANTTIEGTSSFLGKKQKAQPFDRITLKDTGGFYASFIVKPYKGGFEIDADATAGDKNLFDELGNDILGLNDENLQIIINFYKDAILKSLGQL